MAFFFLFFFVDKTKCLKNICLFGHLVFEFLFQSKVSSDCKMSCGVTPQNLKIYELFPHLKKKKSPK